MVRVDPTFFTEIRVCISEFERFNPIIDADGLIHAQLKQKILNGIYKVGTCDMLNFPFFACENFMSDSGHK